MTAETNSVTELMRDADAACYVAKDMGRNRVHVHNDDDTEIARHHGEMQWLSRLDHAIEKDKFCLYAQPIVSIESNDSRHYELLIRMIDKEGEVILPNAFLPAAERYNLITKLDKWVIINAFETLIKNPAFVEQLNFVSINLSGTSLTNESFLKFVISQLNKHGVDPKKICFEITETAAISNFNKAIKFITTLKAVGCKFALDDFGSGLSSFAYLKNLPVDYLKIDGTFVKDMVDDPIDHAMVKSINEIGQVMGKQTIAEFVENDEIMAELKKIGVNYAQGYGIGIPMPFNELAERKNYIGNIKSA
jgi:EAL domain-containing protein (putative c-di-GMP-specific phosphodiesterase class I)